MSDLAGTGALVRLALRRDRVRLPVWVAGISGLVFAQVASLKGLYPGGDGLAEAAALVEDNPAFIAMTGPARALETLGGRTSWEILLFAAVVVALMNIFLVTRHTRAEEESGRAELVRATVVGRHAALTATLAVALIVDVALAALLLAGLAGFGLPMAGSVAMAASLGLTGLAFAAVAAVTAQVTESGRAASGMAGALLGGSYVVRAVGDVGSGALSWLSPLGWAQSVQPYAGERWWVLALPVAATVAALVVARALEDRRDHGAGLVPPRPGPARAGTWAGSTVGLALRLQRGAIVAWSSGLLLTGVAYGAVGNDVEDLASDTPAFEDIIAQGGGSIVDGFLATSALMLALIGAAGALQVVLRARSEELSGRAEPLLATATSRDAWLGAQLVTALLATLAILVAAGVGMGAAYAVATGEAEQVPRLIGALLVQAPAVLVLVGIAAALFGAVPRATAAAWAALGVCLVVGLFGELLQLPGALRSVSPFHHLPLVPVEPVAATPLVLLLAVAAGLAAVGHRGLRRRDLHAT
ncbi:MAG: ABC transporter permease [Acidimicrobiales bacterium]